jgi:hypothetical protein
LVRTRTGVHKVGAPEFDGSAVEELGIARVQPSESRRNLVNHDHLLQALIVD